MVGKIIKQSSKTENISLNRQAFAAQHRICVAKASLLSEIFSVWLFDGMPKSLCNHELSVVIVTVICDQFSYTHTKSKKVSSLHVVALSYNFTSMKVHFCMY